MPGSELRPVRRGRSPVPIVTSPRIERLRAELSARRPHAAEAFWAEVHDQGTPLIEDDPAHPHERIVTFVWRGGEGTRKVVLFANKLFDRSTPDRSRLQRLGDTDIWHLSHRLPADWRGSYHLAVDEGTATARDLCQPTPTSRTTTALRSDPFNGDRLPHPPGPDKAIATLPGAPPQPYATRRTDGPATRLELHRVRSAHLGNERRVWLHRPDAVAPTDAADLCIVLDGEIWVESIPLAPTLDNLVGDGAIPPTVTAFVESMPGPQRAVELCCHEPFVRFLAEELRPWLLERLPASDEPARCTLVGQSFGGLAALFAGWTAPRSFGRVLAQSASLWWGPDGRSQWLTDRIASAPGPAPALYLEVGSDEGDNLEANRRLHDVLQAAATAHTYHEFTGGHDRACWRGGVADGLRALAGATQSV